MRGEANCWGSDPLRDVEGGTPEGLKMDSSTRLLLQTTLHQVRNCNESYSAPEVVSMLAACQALGVADLGCEVKQMFPLRDDEYQGPQWKNATQRRQALELLRRSLEDFLGPENPPVDGWDDQYDMVTNVDLDEAAPGAVQLAGQDYETRDLNRADWPEGKPWTPDWHKQEDDQLEPFRWDLETPPGQMFEPASKGH
uniref:Uncharacterized protein n=1 Tax=Hemiselmis andersenii TaxID=464988 RepID=A0A7S1GTK2_HEMAN|mmetsp:Transcript_14224/g.34640  ORF Transcript_14224/g.34640 Transcript_14224/m.34640 type:complete len:197 (+) Transcript_14224:1-591(+)